MSLKNTSWELSLTKNSTNLWYFRKQTTLTQHPHKHTYNKQRQRIPRLSVRSIRRCAMHFIKNNPSGRQLSLGLSVCLPKPKQLAPTKKPQSAGHGVRACCRRRRRRAAVYRDRKRSISIGRFCATCASLLSRNPVSSFVWFCCGVAEWIWVCSVSCLPDLLFR